MFGIIVQRFLDRGDHPVDVVFVTLLIPDLDGDIIPPVAAQAVLRTQEREEMQDRAIHFVLEIMAVALFPILHQITRGDGTLPGRCAHRRLKPDPVGIPRDIIAHHRRAVIDPGHPGLRLQSILLPGGILAQFCIRIVTDRRQKTTVDEGSVVYNGGTHSTEISVRNVFHLEIKPDAVARQDRFFQSINADAMIRIVNSYRRRRVEFHDRVVIWTLLATSVINVQSVDRTQGAIKECVLTNDVQGLVIREDIHR